MSDVPLSPLVARLEADQFDAASQLRGLRAPFAAAGAVLKAQGAVLRDLKDGPDPLVAEDRLQLLGTREAQVPGPAGRG